MSKRTPTPKPAVMLPEIPKLAATPQNFTAEGLAEVLADLSVRADLAAAAVAHWKGDAARGRLVDRGLYVFAEPEPEPVVKPEPEPVEVSLYDRNGKRIPPKPKTPFVPIAVCTRAEDVQAEAVEWLWPGRIPLRRVTGILGRQGKGKSTLLSWLASAVSAGQAWPDGAAGAAPNVPGSVIVLQAEEIVTEDYIPRLEAMGAVRTKIKFVDAIIRDHSGAKCHPNLARDIEAIGNLIDTIGDVRLLVVDPLGSYVSGISGYNDAEVRAFMAPLFRLAEEKRIAVVLFMHPSKDQEKDVLDRAGNSSAFTQMIRMFWYYSTDPKNRTRRLISLIKGNTRGATKTALSVGIRGDRLSWNPRPVKLDAFDADNALRRLALDERLTGRVGRPAVSRATACEFILGTIDRWPMMQGALEDTAGQAGICRPAFRRAFLHLEETGRLVRERREGAIWFIPPAPEPPPEAAGDGKTGLEGSAG